MLVLVGRDNSTLEVDHKSVGGEEVRTKDGLLHDLEVPREPASLELEWDYPRPKARMLALPGPTRWCLKAESLPDQAAREFTGRGSSVDQH